MTAPLTALLERVEADNDPIHLSLRAEIEKPERGYLWIPADAITFVPHVSPVIYGDGRALFALATINQRPAYWVIRGCSTWGCGYDSGHNSASDFGDMADDILTDLEEAFGNGRCGYSGNSLFWPATERIEDCQCEDCSDENYIAAWPMVDGDGGCSWSRIDWPKSFPTTLNPLSRQGNLLDVSAALIALASRDAAGPADAEGV